MTSEGFLRRWSRLKGGDDGVTVPLHVDGARDSEPTATGEGADTGILPHPPATAGARASPTLDEAMRLTPESDYSAFVARDVDKAVRRMALKKLFADPYFNRPDGLDIYMADYNRADPLPAPMLAALRQAQDFLPETPLREPEAGGETARGRDCQDAGDGNNENSGREGSGKGDAGTGSADIQAQANKNDTKGDDEA